MAESTANELRRDYFVTRVLDNVAVKGKTRCVKIYELIGFRKLVSAERQSALDVYDQAFDAMLGRDFEGAIRGFKEYLERIPDDVPAKMHLQTSERLLNYPPSPDWSYSVIMEEK